MSFKGDTMTWLSFPCDYHYLYLSRKKITIAVKCLLSFSAAVTQSGNNPHLHDKASFICTLSVLPKTSVLRMVSHTSVEPYICRTNRIIQVRRKLRRSLGLWPGSAMTQGFNPVILLMPSKIHNLLRQPVSLHGCSHSESWTLVFVALVFCLIFNC